MEEVRVRVEIAHEGRTQLVYRKRWEDAADPGRELPGFERERCIPLEGDSLRHPVRWGAVETLPGPGIRFRIKLELRGSPSDALYGVACR